MTSDAPRPSAPVRPTARVRVDHYSAVHLAASTAREVAVECGLTGALPDRAAVLASELASNLAKHASDGTVYIQPLPLGGGVEILAVDRGPGIADLEEALRDGFTTTGTLGAGLGAVKRLASDFTLRTRAGGTLIAARLTAPEGPVPAGQSVGGVCLPAQGEEACGDAFAVFDEPADDQDGGSRRAPDGSTGPGPGASGPAASGPVRTALVVDGLGHGSDAADAARAAVRAFHAGPERPLPELFAAMNRAVRRTRGAAIGVLRVRADGRGSYCATGNTRALLLSPDGIRQRLINQPGVVGWNMPRPVVRTFTLAPGETAVLHSDGIEDRWSRDTQALSPFLLRLPPVLFAAALAHGHGLGRDDATALALRGPENPS
ncbi:SpoIIE family protein phosphatase [Streptomyces sp. NPDC059740]|uniref:SpoIIE family protein phosphatase n=1 Tax=Streptomyces sp. NPDC059740 TaxID=3346926 RepID=UPI0036593AD7